MRKILSKINQYLNKRSMIKNRSRLGWNHAYKYKKYWDRERKKYTGVTYNDKAIIRSVNKMKELAVSSIHTAENHSIAEDIFKKIKQLELSEKKIWDEEYIGSGNKNYKGNIWNDFPELEILFKNSISKFLINYLGCNFKIYNALLFTSEGLTDREGSQIWHSDSGPGSCVNIIFYLTESSNDMGALEVLPWEYSREIFLKEYNWLNMILKNDPHIKKPKLRVLRNDFYNELIINKFPNKIESPTGKSGIVVPFCNNLIHRGGWTQSRLKRYAFLFHCYPSDKPSNYEKYRQYGISKSGPYPDDPAMYF